MLVSADHTPACLNVDCRLMKSNGRSDAKECYNLYISQGFHCYTLDNILLKKGNNIWTAGHFDVHPIIRRDGLRLENAEARLSSKPRNICAGLLREESSFVYMIEVLGLYANTYKLRHLMKLVGTLIEDIFDSTLL